MIPSKPSRSTLVVFKVSIPSFGIKIYLFASNHHSGTKILLLIVDSFLYLDIHSQLKELDKVVGDREENYEENQKLSFHWGLQNKYVTSNIFCQPSYLMNLPERSVPLYSDGHHRVHRTYSQHF